MIPAEEDSRTVGSTGCSAAAAAAAAAAADWTWRLDVCAPRRRVFPSPRHDDVAPARRAVDAGTPPLDAESPLAPELPRRLSGPESPASSDSPVIYTSKVSNKSNIIL